MDDSDNMTIQFVRDSIKPIYFNILAQVRSHHSGRKVYRCFIENKPNKNGWSEIS